MVVNNPNNLADHIIKAAIEMMAQENPRREIVEITVRPTGMPDEYGIVPKFKPVPFDRIRRITGYLVGTTAKWNDAKLSELGDRVKHGGNNER